MGQWTVEYQGADKKPKETWVTVSDALKTAREVQAAIEKGEVGDLYIPPGAIVRVQKYEPPSFA